MNKDILILGKGFIGSRLREALDCRISGKIITDLAGAEKEILKYKPKVIINCIGATGKRNVDDCELAKDDVLFANTYLPIILAEAALRNNIKLVHISSGCIYHYNYAEDKPIVEEKEPDYFDLYYSRTKIYAERALEALSKKYNILICRIRIPLDDRPHPRNIINKLIKYKHVVNLPNSLSYIPDFLAALKHLLKIDARGIYNIVNKGGLRYPELLDVYKKYVPDFEYSTIAYKKLKLKRTNLILSTRKLERSGFRVRDIHKALEECVSRYVKY